MRRFPWRSAAATLLLAYTAGYAGAAEWAQTLGGTEVRSIDIARIADGGYIVAATNASRGLRPSEAWLAKLDASGRLVWHKSLGEGFASTIESSPDGGFVVARRSTVASGSCGDFSVVKFDASGSIEWKQCYSSPLAFVNSLRRTADGGYIAAGAFSRSMLSFGWLLKLDGTGTPAWQAAYVIPGINPIGFVAVEQAPDGGFVAVGTYRQNTIAERDQALVMKIDAAGNFEWSRAFGIGGASVAAAVRIAADGTYLIGGQIETPTTAGAWVARLDASGNVLWQRMYGSRGDAGNALEPTADGGAVLTGRRVLTNPSTGGRQEDMWLLKLDASGAIQWQRTYGGSLEEIAYGVQLASEGGYVVAGTTRSFASDASDAWVLKVAFDGVLQGCPLAADSQATATVLVDPPTTLSATSSVSSIRASDFTLPVGEATLRPSLQCVYRDLDPTDVPTLSPLFTMLLAAIVGVIAATTSKLRGSRP